mmetsp:Transcript_1375/g.4200  ORF Transcript_1375/g.4200 Transcript_1375/m.4200 type:complete len:118 (-) Transcript_1375:434-787(-)
MRATCKNSPSPQKVSTQLELTSPSNDGLANAKAVASAEKVDPASAHLVEKQPPPRECRHSQNFVVERVLQMFPLGYQVQMLQVVVLPLRFQRALHFLASLLRCRQTHLRWPSANQDL